MYISKKYSKKLEKHLWWGLFCCQRRSSCWKYWKWCSYLVKSLPPARMVEKKIINFSVSPYCTLLFSRTQKYQVFGSNFGSCQLQFPDQLLYDFVKISTMKYYHYYSGYLLACGKRQLKHWNKMERLFKRIIKCTRTNDCRSASVFLKHLEHLYTLS